MEPVSIAAYDLPERVAAYDADMEVMHPNRTKMVDVAIEVLPFGPDGRLTMIDLGVGTGFLTERFLKAFPRARVTALDGASSMIELARTRLGALAGRVTFVTGDFRELTGAVEVAEPVDAVLSAYALHHLTAEEKQDVIGQALALLRPGGWFVNADLVVAQDRGVEQRIQELRVEGVVRRAGGEDPRFADAAATRFTLDELEAREADQPVPLARDLEIARQAGLESVEVFWKEYREVVYGGPRR